MESVEQRNDGKMILEMCLFFAPVSLAGRVFICSCSECICLCMDIWVEVDCSVVRAYHLHF